MRNEYLGYTNNKFLGNKDYGKSYVYEEINVKMYRN